jgi:hypothetical protein
MQLLKILHDSILPTICPEYAMSDLGELSQVPENSIHSLQSQSAYIRFPTVSNTNKSFPYEISYHRAQTMLLCAQFKESLFCSTIKT